MEFSASQWLYENIDTFPSINYPLQHQHCTHTHTHYLSTMLSPFLLLPHTLCSLTDIFTTTLLRLPRDGGKSSLHRMSLKYLVKRRWDESSPLCCHLTGVIDSHRTEQDQSGLPIKSVATGADCRGQGIKRTAIQYAFMCGDWRLFLLLTSVLS